MKKSRLIIIGILLFVTACKEQTKITTYKEGDIIKISKQDLLDKIKGGWAGQVIGCPFGGPTEFKYNGTFIDDYVPVPWDELFETVKMPADNLKRRPEVAWKYDLPEGDHSVRVVLKDLPTGCGIQLGEVILYSITDPGPQVY